MAGQSNREREISSSALDPATPAERAAYLDGACGKDAELRARVEALIHAHEQVGGFLPTDDPKPSPSARACCR